MYCSSDIWTAIIISGQCRTCGKTAYSIRKNVIGSLEGKVVPFLAFNNCNEKSEHSNMAMILNTTYSCITKDTKVNNACSFANSQIWLQYNLQSSFLKQFNAVNVAYNEMIKYETLYSRKFDWVLRLRPDMLFIRSILPICFFPRNTNMVYTQHYDFVMLAERNASDYAIDALTSYKNCKEKLPSTVFDPETFVKHYVERAKYRVITSYKQLYHDRDISAFSAILLRNPPDPIQCRESFQPDFARACIHTLEKLKTTSLL